MAHQEPQRSCVGCGVSKDKRELLRFVLAPDNTLALDVKGKLPGRGSYICCSRNCLLSALKKKQFNRAFHADIVVPEPDALLRQVADTLAERVVSYLALANKAGQTVSGSDMVMDAVRHTNRVGLVIIAADTSPDIAAKIARLAERQQIPHLSLLDRDTIGAVLGKGLRSVVAIKPGGFVAAIREEFERYRNFVDGGAR